MEPVNNLQPINLARDTGEEAAAAQAVLLGLNRMEFDGISNWHALQQARSQQRANQV